MPHILGPWAGPAIGLAPAAPASPPRLIPRPRDLLEIKFSGQEASLSLDGRWVRRRICPVVRRAGRATAETGSGEVARREALPEWSAAGGLAGLSRGRASGLLG